MSSGLGGEAVLVKVYGAFKLLGFDSCGYLEPADHATLAAVEKYGERLARRLSGAVRLLGGRLVGRMGGCEV
jgi:hypothetical protein